MPVSSTTPHSSSAHRSFGHKLRQATFILPRTGQRIKAHITLGSGGDDNTLNGDRTPLLPQNNVHKRGGHARRWMEKASGILNDVHSFAVSETGKGVLKCSLAYLIGTLATFVPAISSLLGQQDGKHTVATITVYFHPARTKGSMFEALIYATVASSYAAFISITSMSISMFIEDTLHLLPLGHAIVLIVFCGGGLGFIGWVKLRRGDPLANVACSLASLAIITVLTKEGAVQQGNLSFVKISQVLQMLVMGVLTTMAICFLVFPLSARTKLRQNLIEMTGSLSDMLGIITESFLHGSQEKLEQEKFIGVSNKNKKAYIALDKLLGEAKYEHYVAGTESEHLLEKRLVRCIQDLTQSIGGLRSAAALQFDLLKQPSRSSRAALIPDSGQPSLGFESSSSASSPSPKFPSEESGVLRSSTEGPCIGTSATEGEVAIFHENSGFLTHQSPAEMFEQFIFHLGPSMRSLAYTLREILIDLPYGPAPEFKISFNSKFRTSLDRALDLYRHSRKNALNLIYLQKDFTKTRCLETEADLEEVAASCGHFSFSLQEFGEQLKDFLQILDELQLETEERPGGRSWNWLKIWRPNQAGNSGTRQSVLEPDLAVIRLPDQKKTMPLALGDPEKLTRSQKIRYRLWKALRVLRQDDTKFAIKVGAGASLYAFPSFLNSTRPVYAHWRGEWGLLSYMLVCSMTIGASNTTGYARFLGTSLGAICALITWHATGANVFGLAFVGWAMALWTAYIILAKDQGPMGRFIMLTYNLSVLYAYSLSHKDFNDDQDEGGNNPIIAEITLHRVISVLSGVIWGIFITRVIWPISARRKLKDSLSLLWLRMSVIWKRDPLSAMIPGKTAVAYFSPREKLELQRFLARLEALHLAAQSEFEIIGPFPDVTYGKLLNKTRRMLDAFQAMNLEIIKNLTASDGEAAVLRYTTQERMQLSARISHLLSVLASSMKLEYPLNDALPDTNHARERLLTRLHRYRNDEPTSQFTTDKDYALLYAYVLVTGQLCNEIMEVIGELSKLFGVLNEDVLKLQ